MPVLWTTCEPQPDLLFGKQHCKRDGHHQVEVEARAGRLVVMDLMLRARQVALVLLHPWV